MDILKRIENWNKERGLNLQPHSRSAGTRMLVEELMEYNGLTDDNILETITVELTLGTAVNEDEKVDALCDLIVVATGELLKLGYDPNLAMEQTLLEIESRTGAFNEDSGKWEKFKTPEAQAKWYTAQYGLSKIYEENGC